MSTLAAPASRARAAPVLLWLAQAAVAAVFFAAGMAKLSTPIAELAQNMPWAGAYPAAFVRFVGLVDLAGAVGLLLPAMTRIAPRLTVWAACGGVLLQMLAMALHTSRGEFNVLPLNAVLLLLCAFVAWGRSRWVVIAPLHGAAARRRALVTTLWLAQGFVALVFIGAGLFKMSAPIAELATALKWPGELPPALVRLIGAIDVAGGLGILLPALTRIRPWLTPLAALGCTLLQMLAIAFHAARGEWAVLPLNALLLPCALWVLWGRWRVAPITARD